MLNPIPSLSSRRAFLKTTTLATAALGLAPAARSTVRAATAGPQARARDFAAFVALARTGRALPSQRSSNAQEEQAHQRKELERSLDYCRKVLGLGLRG